MNETMDREADLEDENRRLRAALTPSEERLDWIADKLCETWGSLDEGPETKDTQRFVRAVLDVLRADAALAVEPASGEATLDEKISSSDMERLGRVYDDAQSGRAAHPPPPTQSEEEKAKREAWICGNRCGCVGIPCRMAAALRQRADEATEEAAKIAELWAGMKGNIGAAIAAAIRARIAS